MGLSVTVGNVTININPNAEVDPVALHSVSEGQAYTDFAEVIVKSGLAQVAFEAFSAVAQIDTPSQTKFRWPPGYGTNEKPWGQPADSEGRREVRCEDNLPDVRRWSDSIQQTAVGRKSLLDDYAEKAIAIATAIKSALESNIKCGRVTLGGSTTVPVSITNDSEVFFFLRQSTVNTGMLSLGTVTPGDPGSFQILSTNPSDDSVVSWLVVGG